jgi:hypothetical protein
MARPTVRAAVAGHVANLLVGDAPVTVTCAQVATAVAGALGYEPTLPAVSRALGELPGWNKTAVDGKVAFQRNGIGRTELSATPS